MVANLNCYFSICKFNNHLLKLISKVYHIFAKYGAKII